ncbi:MAG: hypothetical protein C4517_10080 [Stygiobacter sp.]|nr:MAG: hypothetical protein C4517_10080 [Stygiobacter sp.]
MVTFITGILQISIISRLIGPEGVGVLGLFMASAALIYGLLPGQSSETVLTFVPKYDSLEKGKKSKEIIIFAFSLDIFSSLVSYIIIVLISPILLKTFSINAAYQNIFLIYSTVIIFISPIVSGGALLRLRNLYKTQLYISLAVSAFKILFSLIIWILRFSFDMIILSYVIISLLEGILTLYYSIKNYEIIGNSIFKSVKNVCNDKEIISFQFQGYLRSVIKSLSRYLDTLIMGYFSNSLVQVGYYRISKQILNYVQLPFGSLMNVLYPEYSKLWYAKKIPELKQIIKKIMMILGGICFLIFIIFFAFNKNIILILFGNQFIDSSKVLLIMVIVGILNIIMIPWVSVPVISGNARAPLIAVAIALIFQIIAIITLVPTLQAIGAALSNLIYMLIWAIVLTPFILKILKIGHDENSLPIA